MKMKQEEEIINMIQPESINKKEHLALKLIIFVTLYILLNYFILSEIYSFLGIQKNQLFTLILVLLSFSYVIGAAAIRYSNKIIAKTLYFIGSTWLGIMILATTTFIIIEILIALNILSLEKRLITAFITIIALTSYSLLNTLHTTKKTINITTKKITKPITLVQITDLHIGTVHTKNFLQKIIRKINQEKPNITVITGDLIDGKHKYEENYFDVLQEINSPVYMVLGNHERMTGIDTVEELLKNSNIQLLRDQKILLGETTMMGIDDMESGDNMIHILKELKPVEEKYNILLYHRPVKFKQAIQQNIDLMLTGHTHAGQIFPVNMILKFFYKKVKGLKKKNNSYLYVSPGTGWWGPSMRLGSKNEITIFKIKPE